MRNYVRAWSPSAIGEYSYGLALTIEAVENLGGLPKLAAAPLMPTLQHEANLGFDIALQSSWLLLCLQYKIPQRLERRNAGQAAQFGVPYFRFEVKTNLTSNGRCQHNVLYDLELSLRPSGGLVRYAAPLFDTSAELSHHALNGTLIDASVFIAPSVLGRVSPGEKHCFAYTTRSNVRAYSEPGPETNAAFSLALDQMLSAASDSPRPLSEFLERMYSDLREVAEFDLAPDLPVERRLALAAASLGLQAIVVQVPHAKLAHA